METTFPTLKTAVFEERPVLKNIYQEFGAQSVFDYVNQWKIPQVSVHPLFLEVLGGRISSLYGVNVASAAINQLSRSLLVSTVDHHGILNHPFFINSNLLCSLHKGLDFVICLSTAGVSMNNNSSWSGCLLYHIPDTQTLQRLPVVAHSRSMQTVFAAPAITSSDREVFFKRLAQSTLPSDKKDIVHKTMRNILSDSLLEQVNFSDQASSISYHLWQHVVPAAPKVLYVSLEDIVGDILQRLLREKEELFSLLLCTEEGHRRIDQYFHGKGGGFTNIHKGSFLFWGVGEKGKRVHLKLEGGHAVGEGFSLRLDSQDICQALHERRIYPTSLLCFLVLLNFDVTCLGGFNQTTWLTEIKQKFTELLSNLSFAAQAKKIQGIPTSHFAETPLAFLYKYGRLFQATGIDLMFERDPELYGKYRKLAETLTMGESMDMNMPEIYKVIFPGESHHGTFQEQNKQSQMLIEKIRSIFS
jgi:hypothetical protein